MEEIDIPPHFICPISLQLMRDPVTVSTGITYDRENIEKWLFSTKNSTCPVTKQVLSCNDLTPNHTLRRLIQSWCILNASFGIERIPTPKPQVEKSHIAKLIYDAKEFPHMQHNCLKRLKAIASESERNRKNLESAGGIEFLFSIVKKEDSENREVSLVDEAISILYHLEISESHLKNLVNRDDELVQSLVRILSHGIYQSRAYAMMLLKSMFELADPFQLICIGQEFFTAIAQVLRDRISHQASKAALKLLVEICPWGRNRIKVVEAGVVSALVELLLNGSERRECELILVLLDQLCSCAEGRAELINHKAGLAIVSKKILRVSKAGSDRAVRILWSVCRYTATSSVLQEMLEVGAVSKLCLLIQVEGSCKSMERSREILKLHSRVWKNSPCISPHVRFSYPS